MSAEEETKVPEAEEGAGQEEEETVKEEESNAHFEPLVRLEEVEVKSGEEDEDILYTKRAKLYIFGETMLDQGTGNKNWRERGTGDARLLRHRESGAIRMLMRQEKTLKIIANFIVQPEIVLVPNVSSDRSWCFNAFDFSDGEKLVETSFAIRFADTDIAKEFSDKFEICQKEMKILIEGKDNPEAAAAGDEAAAALAGLSTNDNENDAATPAAAGKDDAPVAEKAAE